MCSILSREKVFDEILSPPDRYWAPVKVKFLKTAVILHTHCFS